jgi:hypothetical protein
VASAALLLFAAPAGAGLIADYQFNGTLASSVGTAPPLGEIGTGASSLQTEAVNGCTRQVLAFPRGHGFSFRVPFTTAEQDYSVSMDFRLDSNGVGDPTFAYRRLLGFDANPPATPQPASDTGLYFKRGVLDLYRDGVGDQLDTDATRATAGGTWVRVGLKHDDIPTNAQDTTSGFLNGATAMSLGLSPPRFGLPNDTLTFFKDDGSNEESGGAIARIMIWDSAPSAAEVASPPPVPCATAVKKKCKRKKAKKRSAEVAKKKKKKCRKHKHHRPK